MSGKKLVANAWAAMAVLLAGPGLVTAQNANPPQVVEFVDLERYDGLWFELARTTNPFQFGCTCVTAAYDIIAPTTVSVYNVCNTFTAQGPERAIDGVAEVVDESSNAKLRVSFFDGAPPGDYWIVDLVEDAGDPLGDYRFAAVSDRSRTFVFILARTPTLESAADKLRYRQLLSRLQANGFDTGRLMRSRQPANCDYSDRLAPSSSLLEQLGGVEM